MSIPITVLCGFLGSGKTTLLRRWKRNEALRDAAIIVHDLSEFGLDAELVGEDGDDPVPGRITNRVAALHGRHAREQLHASLGATLEEMAAFDPPPPLVLVESTGAARPWPLILALTESDAFHLRHFIVTVDALNLHRDFENGVLLEAGNVTDAALQEAASILLEQLCFANIIVLTKVDTVPRTLLNGMVKKLQQFNPHAAVALSAQAGLELAQLESINPPKMDRLRQLAATLSLEDASRDVTATNVESILFKETRPFHPIRLWECCQQHLQTGLYRMKGYLWLASRPGDVLLWQQSGSQISLEFTGFWRAELVLNREGKLLPEEVAHLERWLKGKDIIVGDRHVELTLIGQLAACETFAGHLKSCLCTDAELAAWQSGATFDDPWPKELRKL